MLATDSVALADARVNADGYLEAVARTARTGVQTYRGAEVGRPDLAMVAVYRDAAEVFSKRSLDTFAGVPITIDHPAEPVSSANWKRHAVGEAGDEVLRDGEHLKIGLKIKDAAAVKAVQDGKRELSVGYTTELVWDAGTAPDGTPYQARQTAIAANHIAIVAAGRAGPQCRIGDSWADFTKSPKPQEKPSMTDTRTVMVDGFSVLVTDQSAQAIEKLLADRDSARKALTDAETAHKAAITAKDEQIGTLTADKAKLEAAAPKPADLDRMVADRVALVTTAKAIVSDLKPEGLTDADIRKAVVKAKLGDDLLKDASDDMVAGMFKALAKDVKAVDPVRTVIAGGAQQANDAATVNGAHAAYTSHLADAWKGAQPNKGAA